MKLHESVTNKQTIRGFASFKAYSKTTNYDYSKVIYICSKDKVTITCKKHGDFKQRPNHHSIAKKGCPECGRESQTGTTESFIKRAIEVHGDRFIYDKVTYIKMIKKVTITCSKHGDFQQTPSTHLAGWGCSMCSEVKKLTLDTFIKKAREIHGNEYNYDNVKYINNKKDVTITCNIHGDFKQSAGNHLRGNRCHKCAVISGAEKITHTKNDFLKKAIARHGDTYDYSKMEYINSITPIDIVCKKHGIFTQTPTAHTSQGQGCLKCAHVKASISRQLTTKEFINAATQSHKNKYDYSKSQYTGATNSISIICPTHGEFQQQAAQHMYGTGCRECHIDKMRKNPSIFDKEMMDRNILVIGKYVRGIDKIKVQCCKCNNIWTTQANVLSSGHGCPNCAKSGFNPSIEAELYIYNIDDIYLGYGITNGAERRHRDHKYSLSGINYTHTHNFHFEVGENAHNIEQQIKKKFIRMDTGIKGFRTEATSISNLDAVLLLIEREMSKFRIAS